MKFKAPTTFLVERAMAKQEAPVDGLKVWRDAAQEQLTEPVVDACLFSRPSNYAANLGGRQFGALGSLAVSQGQKARANGLPQHFIFAVTDKEIVVLERKIGGRGGATGKPGPEVTRWQRDGLQVSWKEGGYLYNARIFAPEAEDDVQCCVGLSPLSEDFLRLLSDPARTTPAA